LVRRYSFILPVLRHLRRRARPAVNTTESGTDHQRKTARAAPQIGSALYPISDGSAAKEENSWPS